MAKMLESPDDRIMMVSSLTRVTAEQVGQAAVGHSERRDDCEASQVMEVQTREMTPADLEPGNGPCCPQGLQGCRGVEAGALQLTLTDTGAMITQLRISDAAF